MTRTLEQSLAELKEIFPDFISITDNWLINARIHGHEQNDHEKQTLEIFSKIMKELGIV